jgi:hydrogenase nickel incorporation protein HypA/HybF
MHELGITRNIVSLVAEAAAGRRVRRVTLEVGKLSGVMVDAIRFCFDLVAEGTVLEGAILEISEPAGRARCRDCAAEFDTVTLWAACSCGSRNLLRLQGEELLVKTMELEEAA